MDILITALSQGLLWALMAIGIYITYRILDTPDLSAEGTFPLGGAVAATLMIQGVSPLLATFFAGYGYWINVYQTKNTCPVIRYLDDDGVIFY